MMKERVIYALVGAALLAVLMTFFFFSNSSNLARRKSATAQRCDLDLSRAPTLRGVRLGMSADELKAKLSSLEIETRADALGFSSALVDRGTKGLDLEGVDYMSLGFVDRQLSNIDFHYINDTAYAQNPTLLIDKVTQQLGMDSRWCEGERVGNCVIKCDGFEVTINAPETYLTGSNLTVSAPKVSFRDLIAQQKLQARRDARDEKARQDFRP